MTESVQSALMTVYEYTVRQNLGTLRTMIQGAAKLRTRLLQDIMCAPEQFLEAQRALFKVKTASNLPDLENLLLPEIMRMPITTIAEFANPLVSAFMTAELDRIFDLNTAIQALLEKREMRVEPEVDDGEILEFESLQTAFSEEQKTAAIEWLTEKLSIVSTINSEALLIAALNDGLPEEVCQCVALMLYQSFADDSPTRAFNMQVTTGRFRLTFASGSTIILQRQTEPAYHSPNSAMSAHGSFRTSHEQSTVTEDHHS